MKKRVFNLLILVFAFAATFNAFSQRKVETTHLFVKSAKNAPILGTDEHGRVVSKDLDLSNVITEDNIDSYIPQIQAGKYITIDFKNPLSPIINADYTGLVYLRNGYRFVGETDTAFGAVGVNAVDLSIIGMPTSETGVYGATGNYSFAAGSLVKASGYASTATGWSTTASGSYSFTSGRFTRSTGENSHSFGYKTVSTGYASFAFGVETDAYSYAETAFGTFNTTPNVYSNTTFDTRDRLFVVGNGTSSVARSDAFSITKGGKVSAPSFDMAKITDPKDLVTLEKLQNDLSNVGGVQTVVAGTNVAIDNTDPVNPIINVSGGINSTDLSYVASLSQGIVESSNGNNAVIPLANNINAGLMYAGFTEISTETVTATMIAHQDNALNGSGDFALSDPNIKVDYTKTGRLKRMSFNVSISYTSLEPTDKGDWIVKIPLTIHGSVGEGAKLPLIGTYSSPDTFDSAFNNNDAFSCKGYFSTNSGEIILKIKLNGSAIPSSGQSGVSSLHFNLVYRTDS